MSNVSYSHQQSFLLFKEILRSNTITDSDIKFWF